jgi:nucleotide-binding universal stress UspA family protein
MRRHPEIRAPCAQSTQKLRRSPDAHLPPVGHDRLVIDVRRIDVHDSPVLICYDGSEGARRAIKAASSLFGARRAVVLDVGPPLTTAESIAAVSSVVPGNAFEDLNTADARDRANAGAAIAREAGFTAEARAELAAPTWEGILDVADAIDAEVIVVGTRGLSGTRELFEGSISHQLAEHSPRPVLMVPPTNGRR